MGPSKDCIDIYFKDLGEMKPLSRDEESKLAIKVKKGNKKAKDALIRANLRLVVSIARKYNHMGLSFLDIIEEGNLGLIKAAEKFDLSFDCKFSTYAAWWIKQKIISGDSGSPSERQNLDGQLKSGIKACKEQGMLDDILVEFPEHRENILSLT